MTRADMIRRLGALRAHVDRELGDLLADLERPAGKSGAPQESELADDPCDVCDRPWPSCTCDPDAPEHAQTMRRLARAERT